MFFRDLGGGGATATYSGPSPQRANRVALNTANPARLANSHADSPDVASEVSHVRHWPTSSSRAAPFTAVLFAFAAPAATAQSASEGTPSADSTATTVAWVDPTLTGPARADEFLSVVGDRAAWLGRGDGSGEVWAHPLILASDFKLSVSSSPDETLRPLTPTEVSAQPGTVELTYRGDDFMVRQRIYVPAEEPGVLMLFHVEADRQVVLRVSFTPVFQYAWPASFGGQYAFWDSTNQVYVLSESLQRRNAVVGSPDAQPAAGTRTRIALDIPVSPTRARQGAIPLAFAGGEGSRDELVSSHRRLLSMSAGPDANRSAWLADLDNTTVRLDTPDDDLDRAFAWAKADLEGQRTCNPALGCGLVSGWRDGFRVNRPSASGAYGGTATGLSLLGLVRTGQFERARDGLRFLARHQRADGKIPGRIPQSAVEAGWLESEDPYREALSTPLWLLGFSEYWRASGDSDLVSILWPSIEAAVEWALARETDDNGIIELDGTGAVPDGPLAEAVEEDAFSAAVWVAAAEGIAAMASEVGEHALANLAADLFRLGRQSINQTFWSGEAGHYAFGRLDGGGRNDALTAWPVVAGAYGLLEPRQMGRTLGVVGRGSMSTHWGVRSLDARDAHFDAERPGYGAVTPYLTAFAAWAEFRYRRPWAGLPTLGAVARLALDDDRGRMASDYSGAFPRALPGALSQSSPGPGVFAAAVVSGLLGWEPDGPAQSAIFAPQLPPAWDSARVEGLPVGSTRVNAVMRQSPGRASTTFTSSGDPVSLTFVQAVPIGARVTGVSIDGRTSRGLHATGEHDQQVSIELRLRGGAHQVDVTWTGGTAIQPSGFALSTDGERPTLRVLDVRREGPRLMVQVEGQAGQAYELEMHGSALRPAPPVEGASGPEPEVRVLEHDGETGVTVLRVTLPGREGRVVAEVGLVG